MENKKTEERKKELRARAIGRRKKKFRLLLFLALMTALLYVLFNIKKAVVNFLWNTQALAVKKTIIIPHSAQPLITGLIEIETGKNLLFLDIDELRKKVLMIQEIEDCSVRKIYPGTVFIEAVMRKPWVTAEKNGNTIFIDRSGKVLYPIEENFKIFTKAENILFEEKAAAESESWKIETLKEIEALYNCNNLQKYVQIEAVNFKGPNEIVIRIPGNKRIIAKKDGIPEKFELLKIALEECEKNGQDWEYIDIRFENPYVRHIEGGKT